MPGAEASAYRKLPIVLCPVIPILVVGKSIELMHRQHFANLTWVMIKGTD
jgi:hypothetical protein